MVPTIAAVSAQSFVWSRPGGSLLAGSPRFGRLGVSEELGRYGLTWGLCVQTGAS